MYITNLTGSTGPQGEKGEKGDAGQSDKDGTNIFIGIDLPIKSIDGDIFINKETKLVYQYNNNKWIIIFFS